MAINAMLTALLMVLAACSGFTEPKSVAETETSASPPATSMSTTTSEPALASPSVSQSIATSGAPVIPAATSAPVPPAELVGGLAGRYDSTDKGTVVAISFEDDRVMRGLCWNIAVWDGAAFVVTYVTESRETAEEASETGISRLTDFGGAIYVCPAIALWGFGPEYFFFPSVVGAGTFRICQDEDCFQFTTDSVVSRPSTSLAPPSPVVSTLFPAPALERGLSPLSSRAQMARS